MKNPYATIGQFFKERLGINRPTGKNSFKPQVDKRLHFSGGVLVAEIALLASQLLGLHISNILLRFTSGAVVGLGKEVMDSRKRGNWFDIADALYTIAGALFGALTYLVMPDNIATIVNVLASSAHLIAFKLRKK